MPISEFLRELRNGGAGLATIEPRKMKEIKQLKQQLKALKGEMYLHTLTEDECVVAFVRVINDMKPLAEAYVTLRQR